MKLQLIYFGRLEREKWFDLVINLLENSKVDFHINIFGKGSMEDDLLTIKTNNYTFHWRKSLDEIKQYLLSSHFSLMPSRFLETFWLVALESLTYWIPVIWFKKWWLEAFVLDNLDINRQLWTNEIKKLNNLLIDLSNNIDQDYLDRLKKTSLEISKNYSLDIRKNNIQKILNWKKILIVSDYLDLLWWIETYIHNTKDILESMWYEVRLFGFQSKSWKLNKIQRLLMFFSVAYNFVYQRKIKKEIENFAPDIIRTHSISRFLWWKVAEEISKSKCQKLIMYHDLWYFHPYPSKVYEIPQIQPFNYSSFIKMWNTRSFLKKLAISFKYIFLNLLMKKLSSFDKHLVPSEFMIQILENHFPKDKIQELSHYLID